MIQPKCHKGANRGMNIIQPDYTHDCATGAHVLASDSNDERKPTSDGRQRPTRGVLWQWQPRRQNRGSTTRHPGLGDELRSWRDRHQQIPHLPNLWIHPTDNIYHSDWRH
ncbi:hypothetical protein TcWFU_002993 [Taenia crassiceps]|uniref:Uncharacterized protein n=1 Tax=Taenia crassiceps TaxID=6207 RepID=A0ABR4QKE1_9CEST